MSDKRSSLSAIAVLFTFSAGVPVVSSISIPPVIAQSPVPSAFPIPTNVPDKAVVRINGSSSMMKINDALAKKFEAKFPGSDVKVAYNGTDAALKAVVEGKADLASIGRPLTDAETAKGLVAVPVARNKIALFVRKDNPLKTSLTIDQFAQIFRGQITDLSKLGGGKAKIRLVDRPETSDTRRAFQNYPVFKSAPFKAGANSVNVKEDSTDVVIKALGKDGIGYAIADQVLNNQNVRVVPMHKVAPSDARYPFSQPLMYVYKGDKPNLAVQAFLGYATADENQKVVEQARAATAVAPNVAPQNEKQTVTASGEQVDKENTKNTDVVTAPGTVADANAPNNSNDFLWLFFFVPFLAGAFWWVLKKFNDQPKTASTANIPTTPLVANTLENRIPESRIILTPRDSQNAYAYWEIPNQVQEDLRREGRRGLKLRLYDATATDTDLQAPTLVQELNCIESEHDLHVTIPAANRDYFVEIGYATGNDEWLKVASSPQVHVTGDMYTSRLETDAELQAASLWGNYENSNLVNGNYDDSVEATPAKASHNNSAMGLAGAAAGVAAGGVALLNRFKKNRQPQTETKLDSNTNVAQTNELIEPTQVKFSSFEDDIDNRTSAYVETSSVNETLLNLTDVETQHVTNNGGSEYQTTKKLCQIILVPLNSQDAYAYWEVSEHYKAAARDQGGQRFVLRVHDSTNLDIDYTQPHATQEYACDEHEYDKHVVIPVSDRDYIAEVGYYTLDNRWIRIIRSFHVRVLCN
ncbi:MAG: DUF4912 domain-containing protein [Calothrix sp. C42_A2020_038]|nr:DUF4912 domain-containing protein [Calothrix sp. C42_A2020_038]